MATGDTTLMNRWPGHLVDRIVSRNFVLVIGAGVSKACTNAVGQNPPSWSELLSVLIDEYTAGSTKTAARRLLKNGDYLSLAELVRAKARALGKEQDFHKTIARVTDGGTKAAEHFQPTELHESLLRLEPDILITTNYDRIFERASQNGYNVHRYDSSTLASDVRGGNPVLIKVHGSVDSAEELILTRSDYSKLRREGAQVLEVVEALFLTRTALFVGYSFNDPDIHLILENILGARDSVPAHYLLTSSSTPEYVKQNYAYSYGTATIPFTKSDYLEMNRMIALLASVVESRRAATAL